MSKPRLEGKVALITGAASGIGEEAVRIFAENGAFIVAVDIQDELGQQVVASIGTDKVCYHHCDVRDEKQVEETVAYTLNKYGSLDILFSNAAIMGPPTGILNLDLDGLDDTMAVNVRGVAATIKHGARAMVAKKIRGSIICTTSVASSMGGVGPHCYTASKHALLGLVRAACSELGGHGIRVNSVSPVCALIVTFALVIAVRIILAKQLHLDELKSELMWLPCWKNLNPLWLFFFRAFAFVFMACQLYQVFAYLGGAFVFYFASVLFEFRWLLLSSFSLFLPCKILQSLIWLIQSTPKSKLSSFF